MWEAPAEGLGVEALGEGMGGEVEGAGMGRGLVTSAFLGT